MNVTVSSFVSWRGHTLLILTIMSTMIIGVILPVQTSLAVATVAANQAAAAHNWVSPVPGMNIVKAFDKPERNWEPGHRGIDVAARVGEPIRAPASGEVRYVGTIAGTPVLSLTVDGYVVSFQPVISDLRKGDTVSAGQHIGTVADESECPGGCIHIGMWKEKGNKDYLDPAGAFTSDETLLLANKYAPENLADFLAATGGSGAWGGHQNGRIPAVALCPLKSAPGHSLRCDAARAFDRMAAEFRRDFGRPLVVVDAYRDYQTQVILKRRKGKFAAAPGTSTHGWGLAVDLGSGVNSFTAPQHAWMRSHGDAFGWVHPAWARAGGSLPEPWHWEFVGGK